MNPIYGRMNTRTHITPSIVLWACLCVCTSFRSRISRITRPNVSRFSMHVACSRGVVLLWQRYFYVLPVLWMKSCFQIMRLMAACRYCRSVSPQRRARTNAPTARYWLRHILAPRLDESLMQGLPGAECAMHHCLVELSTVYCVISLTISNDFLYMYFSYFVFRPLRTNKVDY